MRSKRPDPDEAEPLSLTSMIDVTFLLLIFFLCTLRFKSLEGKLASELPRDAGQATSATPLEPIRVHLLVVDPGRRVSRVTGAPLADDAAEPHDLAGRRIQWRIAGRGLHSPGALVARLAKIHASDDELGVSVHAGAGVLYGDVVTTLDAVAEAGISDVRFAATHPKR